MGDNACTADPADNTASQRGIRIFLVWRILFYTNLIAMALLGMRAFLAPQVSVLSVQVAFRELEQAEAINVAALNPNDARYGFARGSLDYRRTVPAWLAAGPLAAERTNAYLGLAATSLNLIVLVTTWVLLLLWTRRKPAT